MTKKILIIYENSEIKSILKSEANKESLIIAGDEAIKNIVIELGYDCKLINDYSGRPSTPGIYPTQQPDLLHYERPPVSVPNLNALSETADLSVAGLLNN